MAVILKCKMCGGDLNPAPGESVTECEFCGTKQTVPNQDNEKKLTLFSRANRLRFGCEFDKAAGIYESIIAEFPEEAEAYWGLVLCKYGIEYVDDPTTGKKIPTCHRSSFDSVLDDPNLEQALENADAMARRVYRDEAKAIEELRKNIIEVSGKEEPYDIFICYKETTPDGNRTVDSVLAQDVYDALTEKGYRVFFSRVTLEDKLGQEYEPYIFAALNSAKLMLAFGTDYEYYNAVWVKNEWSRFLKLMAQDKGKYLIPCYKNLDPYDMPKEFAKLQAQDMGKVGAMQDLLRGIEKILGGKKTEAAPQPAAATPGDNTAPLLKRAFMFLEDGNWQEADAYCEKVLDIDPENAQAYLGKLMAERQVKKPEALADCVKPFDGSKNYQKVIRFGGAALREQLDEYIVLIKERQRQIAVQREQQEAERQRQLAEQEAERQRQLAEQDAERKRLIAELKDRLVHLSPEDKNTPAYQRVAIKADELKEEAQATETAYRTALENVNREKPHLQAEIEEKKKQKASLSIFSGKERKELQQRIDELSLRLAELENGLSTAEEAKTRAGEACLPFEVYTKMVLLKNKPGLLQKLQELGVTEIELQQLDVPQTIEFGRYIQDENGLAAPIEWFVLDYAADRVLLLSRYALDCQPYEKFIFKSYTWETSSLREWLNYDFINAAFSAKEKAMIPSVTVSANRNPDCSRDPGNDTEDKVFVLSILEAKKYFHNDEARKCTPTAYAIANYNKKNRQPIHNTKDGTATCNWWLREPAGFNYNVNSAYVSSGGDVNIYGQSVGFEDFVRPALWINLSD